MDLSEAVKALKLTDETVLFVDIDQINLATIENCKAIPKHLLIVGVVGKPNVEALTRTELQEILRLKR